MYVLPKSVANANRDPPSRLLVQLAHTFDCRLVLPLCSSKALSEQPGPKKKTLWMTLDDTQFFSSLGNSKIFSAILIPIRPCPLKR